MLSQTQKLGFADRQPATHSETQSYKQVGGFKYPETMLQKKAPLPGASRNFPKSAEDDQYSRLQPGGEAMGDISAKIGVLQGSSPSGHLANNLGIPESFLYSAGTQPVKTQFTNQLLSEVELEIQRLRERRQCYIEQQVNNFIEPPSTQPQKRAQQASTAERVLKLPEARQYLAQQKKESIEETINEKWEKAKPSLDDVESRLQKHRDELRDLRKKYEEQRKLPSQPEGVDAEQGEERKAPARKTVPIYMANDEAKKIVESYNTGERRQLEGIHPELLKYGNLYQIDAYEQAEEAREQATQLQPPAASSVQARYLQPSKKELEKQRKQQIIEEEMRNIELMMQQKKQANVEGRTVYVSADEKQYKSHYKGFLVDKQIKSVLNDAQKEQERRDFERFQQPTQYKQRQ